MVDKIPHHLGFVHASVYEFLWSDSYCCPKWLSHNRRLLVESVGRDAMARCSKSHRNQTDYPNNQMASIDALINYEKTLQNGLKPNLSILLLALKACASLKDLDSGLRIHAHLNDNGDDKNIVVATTLVHMYAKCGNMVKARQVFDIMSHHDLVSWNALLFGYAENGECNLAAQLFFCMQDEGCLPDARTYVFILKAFAACAVKEDSRQSGDKLVKVHSLEMGIAIHSQLAKRGHESNIFVISKMVDVYARCGSMDHARPVFEKMQHHDLVSWTAMLLGYVEGGETDLALQLLVCMQDEGFTPDAQVYVVALKACAGCATKEIGKQFEDKLVKVQSLEKGITLHSQLAKNRCESHIFVASTMLDLYVKCGSMEHARWAFDKMRDHDLVSWSALIFGYVESGNSDLALELFVQMQDEGLTPNYRTYVVALQACASCATKEGEQQMEGKLVKVKSLEKGMSLHSQVAKSRYKHDIYVETTMVDMYAKCGSMAQACQVFEKMPQHDLVSWNAIIFGYVDSGENVLALQLYTRMQDDGFMPDARTYVAALKACGSLVALETGKKIHIQICDAELQNDPVVAASLVVFYGKCGNLVDAEQVFNSSSPMNLAIWNALLGGYSQHGDVQRVFYLFKMIQKRLFQADSITFLFILNACNHAGLLKEGKGYFWAMCTHYMIIPSIEHYTCMVHLLARANHLDDAVKMLKNMPFEPDFMIWTTIVSAMR